MVNDWTLGEYWGPGCLPYPGDVAFIATLEGFASRLVYPAHRRLFDYWCDAVIGAGGLPVFNREWRRTLQDVAALLYIHEFVAARSEVRIRYSGHETERRSGKTLRTGISLAEVTNRTDEFVWERMAPLVSEGRPRLIEIHLGHVARRHLKASLCEFPFLEEPGGPVRFSVGAWGIPQSVPLD